MKKLVIPAILLGALQAAGCIFVSSDDTTTDGIATIDVSWTLEDDGAPASCPAGATTAAINAHLSGRADPFVDLYNCDDLGGVADELPLGDYTVWVDFTDDSGAVLYAQSEAVNITLDTDGEVATANFRVDMYNGFFDISWEIAGGSCASVTNDGVSVLSTLSGTTEGIDDVFSCSDGEAPAIATTGALLIGDYVIAVALLDNDLAIGEAPEIQESIAFGNEFVDLGTVTITLF
jgi:hypothetical protein